MATTDPRVDAYIERATPFAWQVLQALRQVVHTGCPSAVETIKWGMPFFTVDGRILAHMAAFRQHCAFDFWQGRGVADRGKDDDAMGTSSAASRAPPICRRGVSSFVSSSSPLPLRRKAPPGRR
jgi:hypothetical protein